MGLIYISATFLSNLITKNKHKINDYLVVFLLGLAVSFFTTEKVHAFEFEHFQSKHFEVIGYDAALNTDQIDNFETLMVKHQKMGDLCIYTAEKMVWFLPDLTDEQISNMCLATFSVGLAPTTPWSKVIRMFIAASVQYVGHCKNEWNHIQNLLYTAEYHYQMAEFYEDVLEKADIL